jgi:hypothetical protein
MSTTVSWSSVMYSGIDSVAIDHTPIKKYRPFWGIFFIAFMIIGNLFIINLFVGIVTSTFSREKDRLGDNFLSTSKQK